ncbi:MAG: FAD/NAD(P)-binding protein [Deltaproteobacteria bacterium]|jgi:NAD(P)H-flavin reductase|nr:FAD/NAD(P)-binding protein [Deltaproteobacteria bacterium]
MSSAKKAVAAQKGAREDKKSAKQASGTPAKSESKVPAKSEARLPVKKETHVPAALAPKAAAAPVQAGPAVNPYLPEVATVAERIQETAQIVTLRLVLDDPAKMRNFAFKPGQVGQLSVFGAGESTFVINSPPSQKEYLQMSVMKAGEVTSAIHKLTAGDKVGLRAPLGNSFPCEQWKGKDVFFVGGGIGMAPIRTIMLHLLDNRKDYGRLSLLYGARSPKDMAYGYELDAWLHSKDLDATLTIDAPFEGWAHKVGLIPNVLLELAPKPKNCVAVLCGPPIMIKFTLQALQKLAFPDEQIVTTLERRMKCGIGICGRCNIGHKYVCVDGPVFSLAELRELPDEL